LSSSANKGRYWCTESDGWSINIFDDRGSWDGKNWVLDFGIGILVAPDDSIKKKIKMCIDSDIRNGKQGEIRYIIVGKHAAVMLYLLELINFDDLKRADESNGFIDIPDFKFDSVTACLRIDPKRDMNFCATADEKGEIIP
jgi:hypothetical protein